jgi:TRAF3-interacting protein 1
MKSDNVKDRDAKMKYLEKAIFCVSFATGENLAVKPGKVVAGQEPEKTNQFLQMLAKVIESKVDTAECVKRVLNGTSTITICSIKKGKLFHTNL